MIGLIIPPPDIKKLLQKTAQHVAINGSQFQKILTQREQHKQQFAFLKLDSPYRPFYDHRVAQISKQLLQGMQPEQVKQEQQEKGEGKENENGVKEEPVEAKVEERAVNSEQEALLSKIFVELKEPDPEKYIAELPQKISEGQQAMIQHTAQYCAKNGKNFLIALSERQKNNLQFQFLRTSSKNHGYFIKLVTGYTNIIEMPYQQLLQLQNYSERQDQILQKCRGVFEYHMAKQQQTRGKKDQSKQVKESNIDWNDFQLVETISFDDDSSKNITGGELLARIQKHAMAPKNVQQQIINQPAKIRSILQQCHVCRQNILASEMNKHLKTCLGQKKKVTSSEVAQGDDVDIRRNLEGLSLSRPDIFGAQDSKISANEGQTEEKVIFDGQSANLNRSSGSMAMLMFQQKKLKEEMGKQK